MFSTFKLYFTLVFLFTAIILFGGCSNETIKLVPQNHQSVQKPYERDPKNAIPAKKTYSRSLNDTSNVSKQSIEILLKNPPPSNWFKDVLPIFTLLLGVCIKEFIDNYSNRKKTKKVGKRWLAELQILIQPLERQIEEIKKSVDHHKSKHNEPPRMVSIAALECENFESLDKNELLTYINRYYVKDYQKAVSLAGRINLQISIIRSNSKSLKERFHTALDDAGKRHDKFNSNFQALLQALHKYKTILINSEGEGALQGVKFKTLDELYGQQVLPHIEDGKFDYLKLGEEYFSPMITELERLSIDKNTDEMMTYTRKCLDGVAGLKMENVYFILNMTNHIKYFEDDLKALNKLLNEFDSKKKTLRI